MRWWGRWYPALDARSLAVFRIGLGLTVLADTLIRAQDLARHYTDAGVLPRRDLLALYPWTWQGWPHLWSGAAEVQAVWFLITALAAAALAAGLRSRQAALACWVLLRSVQARNPLVLYGVDSLLSLLLFWALFVPLDGYWAVGRRRGQAPPAVASAGTLALALQVSLVHVAAGLYKMRGSWASGTAVWYALQSDVQSTGFGQWWLAHPGALAVATRCVPWVELVGGLLVLGGARARWAGVALLASLHVGIAACLRVGLFPMANLAAIAALAPARVWPGPCPETQPVPARGWQRFALACAVLAVVVTGATLSRQRLPPPVRDLAYLVGMRQHWNMYRNPLKLEGWLVMPGHLDSGELVDLAAGGGPVSYEKPARLHARLRSHRELKLTQRLMVQKKPRLFRAWVAQACDAWAATHPGGPALTTVELVAMVERAPLPAEPAPVLERYPLYTGACPGGAPAE